MKLFFCFLFFCATAAQASVPAAKNFLKELLELARLSKEKQGAASVESKAKIAAISKKVDFEALAQASLGKRWTGATPAFRKDFQDTLRALMETVLYPKAHQLSARLGEVQFSQPAGTQHRVLAKTRYEMEVRGEVVEKDVELLLIFEEPGANRLVDAVIAGEKVSANLKRQFDQALQTQSLEQVLQKLKAQLKEQQKKGAAGV